MFPVKYVPVDADETDIILSTYGAYLKGLHFHTSVNYPTSICVLA